jgi:hypothetical protein
VPYTIKPLVPSSTIKGFGSTLDPSFRELATQDYDPTRAWRQVSSSPTVRGTIAGGPSYTRFLDFGNEQKFMPIAPRPALTTSILGKSEESFYRRQLGALEWDAIDPYSTLDQAADQVGLAVGEDANPLAFLRGAQDFLAAKDIDIFGMEETGAPARAADYALAFPIAIFNKLTDQTGVGRKPNPQGDDLYYKLHADPRYWQALVQGKPADLDELARSFAGQFVDTGTNAYVVEQLRAQFKRDRDVALGLSSGNDAIDYRAIKYANNGLISNFGGLQQIPLVGTQIVQTLEPVTDNERDRWLGLDPEERQALLGRFGVVQMATDLISALPALSGLGTVMQVARTGGTIGRSIASSYDWILRGSGWIASAGLVAAATNWGLSAASPEYSETWGREVDAARPISGSFLAGQVNLVGYFATGTYGVWGAARVGSRVVSRVLKPVAGKVVRGIGMPETPLYSNALGGARMADLAVTAGLHPQTLKLSAERMSMSYLIHLARSPLVDQWDAITSGTRVESRPDLDALSIDERILVANEELRNSLAGTHAVAGKMAGIISMARRERPLVQSDETKRLIAWAKSNARTIDDEIGRRAMADYGPAWVTRTTGAYTSEAMSEWVSKAIARVGGDPTALTGLRNEDDWAKLMRTVHQYEFDVRNAELAEAVKPTPGVPVTREAGRLSLVSSRHLFDDQAEEALAILRGSDLDASRAKINDLIDNTIEGERWFAETWKPPRGKAHDRVNVNPAKMAQWIEDVQATLLVRRGSPKVNMDTADLPLNAFHARLERDGVWDLAFKPVDEAGNFVSYVKTRTGKAFQTPWLDYPMSVDNIELGNRGMVLRKVDGITRAFRTWRVVEFQRGLLFRNLTGGRYELDVTAASIDQFHAGVLVLSRKYALQPQSLGTIAEGISGVGSAISEDVEALARSVFGEGPYLNRAGQTVTVDWREVIAQSYRQSLRLNLTAGLTSHMKSRLGPAGHAAAWWSDMGYVNLRFNFSPIFKMGEVEESLQLNWMAGVDPRGDLMVEALFYRQGVGEAHGVLAQEAQYDQMLAGLEGTRAGKVRAADQRAARAYGWYALKAPETLATKQAKAAIQARAERFGPYMLDEASIQRAYDAGDIAAGQALNREVGIARGGTVESGGAMKPTPEPWRVEDGRYSFKTKKEAQAGADRMMSASPSSQNVVSRGPILGVRPVKGPDGRWRNEIQRGAMELNAPAPRVDLDRSVPPPEHLVNIELTSLVDDAGNVIRGNEERVIELQAILGEYDAARAFLDELDRIPLADDKDGLLRQLAQTMRDDGEPLLGLEGLNRQIVARLSTLDDARGLPQSADNLADVAGTPERLTELFRAEPELVAAARALEKPGAVRAAWETVKNPIPMKQHQALLYRIEALRREFPILLKAAELDGLAEVLGKQLHIPERNWSIFLMRDRELASAFAASGHPDDLAALLAHSGDDVRGQFDALYASEEWQTLTGLWAIADRTAADDAFRVHFFNPYRSALERSLNHPLLGVYPLSWAYKAAREWAKFLFDNRTIAGLRLGMTPAVGLNHITRAQNAIFAQTGEAELGPYLDFNGPFGSTLLIFNLILPGDWSSIPFPASRTIRDLIRKGPVATAQGLPDQISGLGVARDARLALEAIGEWMPPEVDPKAPAPWTPFGGESMSSGPLVSR